MAKPELWEAINRLSENPKAPPHFSRAFISYLHVPKDEATVQRLSNELRAQGITVFLDRDNLNPGQKWEQALRDAIRSGTYFIVCFSSDYARRPQNYMQKEIAIALDQLRSGAQRDGWFIPVVFDDVDIPPLEIRPGYTLESLQWIDLFENWDLGIRRLLRVVRPPCSIDPEMELGLREVASSHIESKISRHASEGRIRIDELEHRWLKLLDPVVWIPTAELVVQLFHRAQQTGLPQTEHFLDKSELHRNVAITVATTMDPGIVLKHLDPGVEPLVRGRSPLQRVMQWAGFKRPSVEKQLPLHPYSRFVARHRTMVREFENCEKVDFVHWIICEDKSEIQMDLLYLPGVSTELKYVAFEMYLREKKGVTLLPHGDIYPTSVISGPDMALTVEHLLQQEVRALKAKQATTV